ncbi:hypothetical protein ACGGAQ_03195 [Micromonospora sp. NPDC047557]|uniref:hypothetical protein n=1 Tax=Micromonospora sp. NPDC047557 TaxID=3364250 RepID=UPI00372001D3
MRFINREELRPKIADLLPALAEAAAAVTAETDPIKRKDVIRRYQPAWVALREEMSRLSHGKCWYTESKNLGADDDIDHFRPKGGVQGIPDHPGYYWLAFDWKNFRLSCHHANRPRRARGSSLTGGKGARFPLLDESKRAFSEEDNLEAEMPLYLDPCDPEDPPQLTFWPNGESAVSPPYRGDPVSMKRWDESRIGLHIDWPDFVDARIELYNKVERLVDRGSREAPTPGGHNSAAFKDVIRDLLELMKPSAEFSMAARAYIETFSHEWWVERIVLRV